MIISTGLGVYRFIDPLNDGVTCFVTQIAPFFTFKHGSSCKFACQYIKSCFLGFIYLYFISQRPPVAVIEKINLNPAIPLKWSLSFPPYDKHLFTMHSSIFKSFPLCRSPRIEVIHKALRTWQFV